MEKAFKMCRCRDDHKGITKDKELTYGVSSFFYKYMEFVPI